MDNTALFPWVVSHLKYLSLPIFLGIITVCWKVIVFFIRAGRIAIVVEQRVLKAEQTIHTMATNHLPHLEMAVNESNRLLTNIDEHLKMVLIRRGDDA